MAMRLFQADMAVDKCACGRVPGFGIQVAGEVRVHRVMCRCGASTDWLDGPGEAAQAWNQGEVRNCFELAGTGLEGGI